jgi:MYXO-CTERM domain-containing protein
LEQLLPFPFLENLDMNSKIMKHMAAAAAAAAVAGAANAAIVTWNSNLVIPNNIDGQYINVETQVYGSAAGLVAGWDLNPYGTSTTTMSWFAAAAPSGCVTGLGSGGTIVGVANLVNGTVVGSASTFGNTASGVANGGWKLNQANYFGFRFTAADGLTHYGYGVMTVGATMGVRTLTSVHFESTAATGITVVAVPAPGALALLGLAGLAGRRRRN